MRLQESIKDSASKSAISYGIIQIPTSGTDALASVRLEGVEPPPLSGQDPKSCASASFAIAAYISSEKICALMGSNHRPTD